MKPAEKGIGEIAGVVELLRLSARYEKQIPIKVLTLMANAVEKGLLGVLGDTSYCDPKEAQLALQAFFREVIAVSAGSIEPRPTQAAANG